MVASNPFLLAMGNLQRLRKGKKKETAVVPIEETEAKHLRLWEIREEGYVILVFQPGINRGAIVQITLKRKHFK